MAETRATQAVETGHTAIAQAPKRQRKPRQFKSIGAGVGNLTEVTYSAQATDQGVEWKDLPNFTVFSTDPSGTFPKVKDTTSSYIDLKTGAHETEIASGRVYRVFM